MTNKRFKKSHAKDALEFFNQVMVDQPLLPFLIPLGLFAWFVERWVVLFSNWVPPVAAIWATIQYGRFKRKISVEDLNKRWKHLILNTTPTTPIEPCEWLNKLLTEVWPNYMEPELSKTFKELKTKIDTTNKGMTMQCKRREKAQKQSSLLSKLTRQLSIHDNRAAVASYSNDRSVAETSPLSPGQLGEDWRSAFSSATNGTVDRSSSHNESRSRSADSRGQCYENGDTNSSNSGSRRTPNQLPPAPPGQRY